MRLLKRMILSNIIVLLAISCSALKYTTAPVSVQWPYGARVSYGEGLHPGIDYDIGIGTPIIACSDGKVSRVFDTSDKKAHYAGGFGITIRHGLKFYSVYTHLSKTFVVDGQLVKRGQLIGLSGAANSGTPHLHFALMQHMFVILYYSLSYNPEKYFIKDMSRCFDPNVDYSNFSYRDITHPVACKDYREILLPKIGKVQ